MPEAPLYGFADLELLHRSRLSRCRSTPATAEKPPIVPSHAAAHDSMTRDPWLSVIVPVFNGAKYLAAALDSVLSETDERTEILVSDDGSTDASPDIIAQYSTKGRVVPLVGPKRQNWVANSNVAVARSRGKLVTFLHQDDLWLPGRLDSIRNMAEAHPDRSLWIGPTRFVDSDGRDVGPWNLPFRSSTTVVEADTLLEHLLVQNFIAMPAPVFPRAAFEKAGGMDEELWFTADWDLWLKLGALAGAGLTSEPTTAFRIHRNSQTIKGASAHASMRTQIDRVRSRYLPKLPASASRDTIERAGRFSCELNTFLAALVSHQPVAWQGLLSAFTGLGLQGCRRFIRDARFLERTMARLRVGLKPEGT